MTINKLDFPLAKAEYLLTRVAEPGEGGDKKNYWQNILGFKSAEAIREAILTSVSISNLQPQGKHQFGDRYTASINIITKSGESRPILTIWLVNFGENTARFITAIPEHKKPN